MEPDPGIANLLIGPGRWRSRGYLPHFDSPEAVQHVSFHLADSLPKEAWERLENDLRSVPSTHQEEARRKRLDAWIDAGHGSCILREPRIAEMVQTALLNFDGVRYSVFAWCVMPNHVHVIFQPLSDWTVAKILASWKKFTARRINDYLRSVRQTEGTGSAVVPVWHREYWDRYVRDESHFEVVLEYVNQNPVKAGLVDQAEDWRWRSAHLEMIG